MTTGSRAAAIVAGDASSALISRYARRDSCTSFKRPRYAHWPQLCRWRGGSGLNCHGPSGGRERSTRHQFGRWVTADQSQGDSDGGSAASTATANDGMATWRTVRPLQSSQHPVGLSDTILYIRSPPIYLTWVELFFLTTSSPLNGRSPSTKVSMIM